jgi:hypothetical protein
MTQYTPITKVRQSVAPARNSPARLSLAVCWKPRGLGKKMRARAVLFAVFWALALAKSVKRGMPVEFLG